MMLFFLLLNLEELQCNHTITVFLLCYFLLYLCFRLFYLSNFLILLVRWFSLLFPCLSFKHCSYWPYVKQFKLPMCYTNNLSLTFPSISLCIVKVLVYFSYKPLIYSPRVWNKSFSDSWFSGLFYLPGPAVRLDIISSNHPGQQRREGRLPAPVSWGDRQWQDSLKIVSGCTNLLISILLVKKTDNLSVNCNGVVWKRSLPPATKTAKTTNFNMSVSPLFAVKHLVYLYLSWSGSN